MFVQQDVEVVLLIAKVGASSCALVTDCELQGNRKYSTDTVIAPLQGDNFSINIFKEALYHWA